MYHHENEAVIILCTVPNEEWALKIANKLLTEKIAACITYWINAKSLYYWNDKLQNTTEVQMLIKSDALHQTELLRVLKNMHPYQIPEILSLPIRDGNKQYLSWISKSLI
ncbi:MAG: divalent cation tolerance protein CutA [Candidatus Dasytiphilus stammeri]